MVIDHIFIFSDDHVTDTTALVKFGFKEGSNRVHTGQGTANRKFYFENFFLEILWVHDGDEIKQSTTKSMGLWERSTFKLNGRSRFGLCLRSSEDTDPVFDNSLSYQPEFFPRGSTINVVPHSAYPSLPWTFRLPENNSEASDPPTAQNHLDIHKLTHATFGVSQQVMEAPLVRQFRDSEYLTFIVTATPHLELEFDNAKQKRELVAGPLDLTIRF